MVWKINEFGMFEKVKRIKKEAKEEK